MPRSWNQDICLTRPRNGLRIFSLERCQSGHGGLAFGSTSEVGTEVLDDQVMERKRSPPPCRIDCKNSHVHLWRTFGLQGDLGEAYCLASYGSIGPIGRALNGATQGFRCRARHADSANKALRSVNASMSRARFFSGTVAAPLR